MLKKINVLSLFDGISCGQQALKELNKPVNKYYASEISIPPIIIAKKNFPSTVELGYVEDVKLKYLPKINLLLAGSPCQGFSSQGKGLNFNDPRSKLFFEFIRILKECKKVNPEVKFLLENVRMKKEWENIITKQVGVEPTLINSKYFSAQQRHRLYWTNIPQLPYKKECTIKVKDILQEPFYTQETGKLATDKKWKYNFNGGLNIQDINSYAPCILTSSGSTYPLIPTGMKTYRKCTIIEMERLQTLPDNYTLGISNVERINAIGNGWTVAVIKHILKLL